MATWLRVPCHATLSVATAVRTDSLQREDRQSAAGGQLVGIRIHGLTSKVGIDDDVFYLLFFDL